MVTIKIDAVVMESYVCSIYLFGETTLVKLVTKAYAHGERESKGCAHSSEVYNSGPTAITPFSLQVAKMSFAPCYPTRTLRFAREVPARSYGHTLIRSPPS